MNVRVRVLGRADYMPVWSAMRRFTDSRSAETPDELWCVEHAPVFTLGRAARREHLLAPGTIEVVASDRGGQVTYHGPGQLVVYTLLDVGRVGCGPRELVRRLEAGVIAYLELLGIAAARRPGAPGVYVGAAKIAALGLRIRNGRAYHGLALNVAMDLEPFTRIDPCGYAGLAVTQLADLVAAIEVDTVVRTFVPVLVDALYGTPGPRLEYCAGELAAVAPG